MSEDYRTRCILWLLTALVTCVLVNVAITTYVWSRGENALATVMPPSGMHLTPMLLAPTTGWDSIRPMGEAYLRQQQSGDMYWVFLTKGVKFQYPPSSLLVMKLLPQPVTAPMLLDVYKMQPMPSLIAVLITIISAAVLWLKRMAKDQNGSMTWWKPKALVAMYLICVLGETFYPLTKGHFLGQIQVYLGALSAMALVLQELGFSALSGACLGLCCLNKPHFALLILWGLLRRQKRFLWGFGIVVVLGLLLSIGAFGLNNHLQYLDVLQYMSRHGEVYGPNQSVNGLLNRFLENGNAILFEHNAFAPYHPVVYYATLASSVLILALALFLPAAENLKGRTVDLAVMMCAATIASPITWDHHYGAFFPVFAVALVAAIRSLRSGLLLFASYMLMANEMMRTDLVFTDRWTGIWGSHIFFGALLLFGYMLTVRFRGTEPVLPRVHSEPNTQRIPRALLFWRR